MMLLRSALAAFSLVAAAPAFAGQAADARLYGHLPYPDADPAMLVAAPEGFDLRQPCLLRREVLPDLTALIAAAHAAGVTGTVQGRSEEHTSELQSLMRISYAVFCLKKKKNMTHKLHPTIEQIQHIRDEL